MPDITDEEIAVKVQQGDIESFGLIMERYEQKITRYAKKFLFTNDDCQDLVQEVFIKAYTNLKSFDQSRKFSSWIYRIAHNEFINAIKKKSREKIVSFDLNFDVLFPHLVAPETADHRMNNQELRQMFDQCFDKLSSKYREPLVLYYFEEMGYKEIAEILHIPISTVGVRLKRGKNILKKMVKQNENKYEGR